MQLLAGRKTYIVAGALVLLGLWMVLSGAASEGMSVILFGLGFTSLGDRANRHQAEILAAIKTAGAIAIEVKSGSGGAAAAARDLAKLAADQAKFGAVKTEFRSATLSCGGQIAAKDSAL